MIRKAVLIAFGAGTVLAVLGEFQPMSQWLPDLQTHRVALWNRAIWVVVGTGPLDGDYPTSWSFAGVGQSCLLHTRPPQHSITFVYARCRVLALLLATYPAIAFIRDPLRRYRRRRRGLCITCGYNLTGNVSGVCPECGGAVQGHDP